MIKQYESVANLVADYSRVWIQQDIKWYNNETEDQTLAYSLRGNTALVPAAERLITSLDAGIETPRKAWSRSPVGPRVSVPDVIAGLPTPMRVLENSPDENAPITILATTTSSGALSAELLCRRGTAILALVLALSRFRPISLYLLSTLDGNQDGTGETILLTRINTTPLDLATACYVLTSSGFDRRITHNVGTKLNKFTGSWPRGFNYFSPGEYYANLTHRLNFDPTKTLVVEAARLDDPIVDNSVLWVQTQVNKFLNKGEEE
jgi:hypothetical protein